MRAQFHIDAPDTSAIQLPQDAPLQPYLIPLRNEWLLVIGPYPLPPGMQPEVATADYALLRMDTRRRVIGVTRFNQPLAGGLVEATEGLSHVETWGRWLETRRIVLHFSRPLPEHANIVIKAQAYGPKSAPRSIPARWASAWARSRFPHPTHSMGKAPRGCVR